MRNSRPHVTGIRVLTLAVLIILLAVGLTPRPADVPGVAEAMTTTPGIYIGEVVMKLPMKAVWIGSYGTENWNEYVVASELIKVGVENHLFLIGWSDYGTRARIYINPVNMVGESTLYGGYPDLISIEGYEHQYAMGSWYETSTGKLYVVGYTYQQQGGMPRAFVMSVKPEDGMVEWVTVVTLGEASEALDVTYVRNEGALAVVGWVLDGGDRDALLMSIDPGTGALIHAFALGDNSYNESAAAVASDGSVEFIAINAVKSEGSNVTSTPSVVMTDWGDVIDAKFTNVARAGYPIGIIHDLEYYTTAAGEGYLVAVGEVRSGGVKHGLIELFSVSSSALTPEWAEYEVSDGFTIYYGVEEAGEIAVAGSYYEPSTGAEEALVMTYSTGGSAAFRAVLESVADTMAVEAFIQSFGPTNYILFGGNANGLEPVGDYLTYNALGGRVWRTDSLPVTCDYAICGDEATTYSARDVEELVPLEVRESTIPSTPIQGKYELGRAAIDMPEETSCLHYATMWFHIPGYLNVYTLTTTESHTYTLTLTNELTVTEVATCTIASESTVTSTETVTSTMTREVPTTVTQYVMVSDERTTYAVLWVGAILAALIIVNLLRRR